MPPRKLKPVSLAPVNLAGAKPRKYPIVGRSADAVADDLADERKRAAQPYGVAASALERFSRAGERLPQGPTPERLLKARGSARIQRFTEKGEVSKGDIFEEIDLNLVRVVVDDGPIARLRSRCQLSPGEPSANAILARSAEMFRAAWMKAGQEQLKAQDPTKEIFGGSGMSGPFGSEAMIDAFDAYSQALDAIPKDFRVTVRAVALEDREPVEVGREITKYRDAAMATAACMFDLRRGLKALALHYGLIVVEETEGAEA